MLTRHWEYPATVWCMHCHLPITLTMSSSVDPARTLHGKCYHERTKK